LIGSGLIDAGFIWTGGFSAAGRVTRAVAAGAFAVAIFETGAFATGVFAAATFETGTFATETFATGAFATATLAAFTAIDFFCCDLTALVFEIACVLPAGLAAATVPTVFDPSF
jgi:hypothetical protein